MCSLSTIFTTDNSQFIIDIKQVEEMTVGNKAGMHSDLVIIKKRARVCDDLGQCMLNNVDVTVFICSPEQQKWFLLNIHMIILHDLPVKVVI